MSRRASMAKLASRGKSSRHRRCRGGTRICGAQSERETDCVGGKSVEP